MNFIFYDRKGEVREKLLRNVIKGIERVSILKYMCIDSLGYCHQASLQSYYLNGHELNCDCSNHTQSKDCMILLLRGTQLNY